MPQKLMDSEIRNLSSKLLQLDEIWAFVGKKQRRLGEGDEAKGFGDVWTFVALDADSKLVPTFKVGKRNSETAQVFVDDLASRLSNRVQLSSDAFNAYLETIDRTFGAGVDYGQIVKVYEAEPIGPGRYSPPKVTKTNRQVMLGNPDEAHISTSFVERQNLTMRMNMRRFTRLTNAFSKKLDNLKAAVALRFAYYNFVRIHQTLRVTPAMEAGVTDRLWSLRELMSAAFDYSAPIPTPSN